MAHVARIRDGHVPEFFLEAVEDADRVGGIGDAGKAAVGAVPCNIPRIRAQVRVELRSEFLAL
jgi:hypothetical protein